MYDEFEMSNTPAEKLKFQDEFYEKRDSNPFGDVWWHKISFLKITQEDIKYLKGAPKLVESVGACPQENVGG